MGVSHIRCLFMDNNLSVGIFSYYFGSHLSNNSVLTNAMSQPGPFNSQLYFNVYMFLKDWMENRLMSTLHNYNSDINVPQAF